MVNQITITSADLAKIETIRQQEAAKIETERRAAQAAAAKAAQARAIHAAHQVGRRSPLATMAVAFRNAGLAPETSLS